MMKRLALSLFKSADEKLRSLGHKSSGTPKSNTYCGPQSFIADNVSTGLRSEPPDVPPPPVPKASSTHSLPIQYNDNQPATDSTASTKTEDQSVDEEKAPALLPRKITSEMAERRVSQYNKRDTDEKAAKRRSKSEGPHGRRRMRNSMHETSTTKTSQNKEPPGRHSMYTGNRSDEDAGANRSGSESANSDENSQKWTKNPLLVRKSRKSDRNSKVENRKSLQNVENGFSKDSRGYSPSRVQKAKFQRMEANRKKRMDMTITSDEECSPQLRISRLRQRAMMGSRLFEDSSSKGELNIVPQTYDNVFSNGQVVGSAEKRFSQYDQRPVSQYNENRQRKYDENDNLSSVNGHLYRQVPVQSQSERAKTNQIKLPDYLPVRHEEVQIPVQIKKVDTQLYQPKGVQRVEVVREVGRQNRNDVSYSKSSENSGVNRNVTSVKLSSESPKLRSFREVKSSQPTPLKQAVGKIEINPRSVNSSSDDSLDELIESNIQYLESEIESGKLKRQSGNFTNAAPEVKIVQRKVIREPMKKHLTIHDEFRNRLHAPGSFSTPSIVPQAFSSQAPAPQMPNTSGQRSVNQTEFRHISASGSATYSPHMKRRNYDYNEDISKSDSQLNSLVHHQHYVQSQDNVAPYPVLNTQTGNIVYIQPEINHGSNLECKSLSVPSMEAGMFSDVDYDIEVSERIRKWEKKIGPAELEATERSILKTIQEYETFSDSNQHETSVPDTPVEIRRELRQLLSPADTSGLGKLSVSLTRSTSSISDSATPESGSALLYFEPKVVSSETNLHRIFRVVNEPRPITVNRSTELTPASSTASFTTESLAVQRKKGHGVDQSNKKHTQSLGNMALSESELGNNSQQTWPPMAVDSDSGVRKSWRMSRYEDEINELKDLVADNFRDLRRKFDSDMSETDTKRESSPVRIMTVTPSETSTQRWEPIAVPVTLNIQTVTPTNIRSPTVVRRAVTKKQEKTHTPPVSPNCPPLTPKFEKKPMTIIVGSRATPPVTKPEQKPEAKQPDVWSPSMESGKGLISIERVKARTLQTIPFSEDPVWKEIEGLTSFDKSDELPRKMAFDDIDALLELATKGTDRALASRSQHIKPHNVMATSFSPSHSGQSTFDTNHMKHRKLSDSALAMPEIERRKVFNTPQIQPLKLNAAQIRKTSTSALDEVLEDIRASLQKKPLSPKLFKNIDTTESNSSANTSLRSPLTKSSKAFIFPKEVKPLKTEQGMTIKNQNHESPGYDNTQMAWAQQPTTMMQQELAKQVSEMPYIDPEFTQFPYIINGNYHLDPDLLSEKLINTGLVAVASNDHASNQREFAKSMAQFQCKQAAEFGVKSNDRNANGVLEQKRDFKEIDQTVGELKNLAHEVEHKLGQIKSRIVSAGEGKLDSILLALRKFAPMTEQKYFSVDFTPSYDSNNAKRGKLEDALTELEKIYDSLNLDDKNLMDRAEREEEIPKALRVNRQDKNGRIDNRVSINHTSLPSQKNTHRKSQIDEVERQTQHEFEDITKSFQVLLDEVTKQCRSVARGSVNFSDNEPMIFPQGNTNCSTQPPANVIHHEPPRQQFKHDSQSQRDLQDSYNIAIKELESVATGTSTNIRANPVKSSVYLNLDSMNSASASTNTNGIGTDNKNRSNGINIKLKTHEQSNDISKKPVSNNFMSMVTEFKPTLATSVNLSRDTSSSDSGETKHRNVVKRGSKSSNGKSRFRKKVNPEHRKSMPAAMRTVETQTIETQTDDVFFEPEKDTSSMAKSLNGEFDLGNVTEDLRGFPVKRKLSTGIARMVDLFSSSEEEMGKGSKLKHSHSAPDIVDLCEIQDKISARKSDRIDKQITLTSTKSSTPRSVKNRHEAKSRFRSLQKGDANINKLDIHSAQVQAAPTVSMSSSMSQGENVNSPVSKPPVYPVWQYPGESPSPKKTDKRSYFGFEREFQRNVSDTETDRLKSKDMQYDSELVRRRTRSVGEEDDGERPKSFHELMAAFESDPGRLQKISKIGLRKCASEESMFIDLVLQRMYPSASTKENSASRRSSDANITVSKERKGSS